MKRLLFLLWLCPLYLTAQINESDTLKLKADLSLTGIVQGGNVQTVIFRAKSDVSYNPVKNWVVKTTNSYVYQEFGREKADEDILSLNFVYFKPQRKLYPLLLAFVSTNFRREIDVRSLLGAGVTYQVFSKNDNWLKFSLTSEYERTKFDRASYNQAEYNGDESINTLRATIWVSGKYQLFDKKMIFSHESYFQPSLERGDNYRWQADLNLEFPIWKFLNFKINYRHNFESIVVEGQKEVDRFMTFGFKVKSY